MRVEFTNLGMEPPDKAKPGRTGQSRAAASAPAAQESTKAGAQASVAVDRARLSFHQTRVATLEAKTLAWPEVRQERVAPLQQAIANGSYAVDAQKVADAMAADLKSGRVR
jgi:flagellar biosynthesis anti-sigma factor FlgM